MKQIIPSDSLQSQTKQSPALYYLAGLSESGRYTMHHALNQLAGMLSRGKDDALSFAWHGLRFEHVTAIRTHLQEAGYLPATVNKFLFALRGVLRAAWLSGQLSADDYHKAASVRTVKNETLPAGRELQSGEITALMETCERVPGPAGVRDAAIVGVMYSAGLRRAEVVTLALSDYDLETGKATIKGKGRKERTAYIIGGAALALADWLAIRGDAPGALFVPINKAGKITIREKMDSKSIYAMLRKRAGEAGVKPFSPHDLRRTFVSDLLDSGADVVTVSKMAGHAKITTTARYDRRPEEAKRKAAGLLHVPYRGMNKLIVNKD
jgi:site-specific recombinase XerD